MAAAGYLEPESRHAQEFSAAMQVGEVEEHGACALEPIRIGDGYGPFDAVRLHGYLAQYGRAARRRERVPETVWDMCVAYTYDDDVRRLISHASGAA